MEENRRVYEFIHDETDMGPYEDFVNNLIKSASPSVLNITDEEGQTILHITAKQHNYKRFRMALMNGADPQIRNFAGNTVLHEICYGGDMHLATAFLHPPTREEMGLLYMQKYESSYSRALKTLDYYTYSGFTALHIAVATNNFQLAHLLLEYGAHANAKTAIDHYTSLHVAVKNNNENMVKLLLKWKADVYARTLLGATAYDITWPRDSTIAKWLKITEEGRKNELLASKCCTLV